MAGKQTADARALDLLPIIRTLVEAGFVSQHALTDELNRRGITAGPGRKRYRSSIARMLKRLGLSTNGKIDTVLAHRRAAGARAEKLASIVQEFRTAGLVTVRALARALNERGISTARRGKWQASSVGRLLRRLKRLDA
jgi:Recombinase